MKYVLNDLNLERNVMFNFYQDQSELLYPLPTIPNGAFIGTTAKKHRSSFKLSQCSLEVIWITYYLNLTSIFGMYFHTFIRL